LIIEMDADNKESSTTMSSTLLTCGVGAIHSPPKTINGPTAVATLELRLKETEAELQRKNAMETKLRDDLVAEKVKVQTLRDQVASQEQSAKELVVLRSVVERLDGLEGVKQKVEEIKAQVLAQWEADAVNKAKVPLVLEPDARLTAEFKQLYGNGSDDVRIEYPDELQMVLIVASAGLTFATWSSSCGTTGKRYVQFADATLSYRIELPLFDWGGKVSTFIERFNGDAPIQKRAIEMIAVDELWNAGDVISLKQQEIVVRSSGLCWSDEDQGASRADSVTQTRAAAIATL